MHFAPVVVVAHRDGPNRWSVTLGEVAETLVTNPGLPLVVRAPGAAIEHVARHEASVWEGLAASGIVWLAGGFSDPVLADLPIAAQRIQMTREKTAMDAAGIVAGGLWVADSWEPGLVSLARRHGLDLVFVPTALGTGSRSRPGAAERAGETVMVVPVGDVDAGEDPDDGLATVVVDAGDLGGFARDHGGCLMDPSAYLAGHQPGEPVWIPTTRPVRTPETEHYYRKLLLLMAAGGDGDRYPDELLVLQSREHVVVENNDTPALHRRLLTIRTSTDRTRHRGDGWVEMTDVDWDADGVTELHVETATTSLVIDPTTATLDVWGDKTTAWPLSAVAPPVAGLLIRRLTVDGDQEIAPEPMRIESRSVGRGEATISMAAPSGLRCRLQVEGTSIKLELFVPGTTASRVGPEIPLALASPLVRVDGGEWIPADEPFAAVGHRFRVGDGTREMLVTSSRPCELFVRPHPGTGVVIWPHWVTGGDTTYQVTLTPS